MKTPLPSLLLLALLCACSKGSGNGAPLTSILGQGQTGGCPQFNGNYSGTDTGGETTTFNLATKVQNGQTYYSFDGNDPEPNFQPADGQMKRIQSDSGQASMQMSCGSGSMTFHVQPDGQAAMDITLTDLGNGKIRATSGGQSVTLTKN